MRGYFPFCVSEYLKSYIYDIKYFLHPICYHWVLYWPSITPPTNMIIFLLGKKLKEKWQQPFFSFQKTALSDYDKGIKLTFMFTGPHFYYICPWTNTFLGLSLVAYIILWQRAFKLANLLESDIQNGLR